MTVRDVARRYVYYIRAKEPIVVDLPPPYLPHLPAVLAQARIEELLRGADERRARRDSAAKPPRRARLRSGRTRMRRATPRTAAP